MTGVLETSGSPSVENDAWDRLDWSSAAAAGVSQVAGLLSVGNEAWAGLE